MTGRTLVELVAAGAERAGGGKAAVRSGDADLAFKPLLEGSRGIARTLAAAGVRRGERIGLWMEKSPGAVQAALGIMAAGAAYVPIDPRSPGRRARAIAADCGLAGLVVDGPRRDHVTPLLEGLRTKVVLVDGVVPASGGERPIGEGVATIALAEAARANGADPVGPKPDDLAYILYTSGSTGTPKGVVHTHASGLAFARWVIERFGIAADDEFSSHAPLHFDLSIADLYASLGSGASVRLISGTEAMLAPYLARQIPLWGITIWYSVPSILIAMLDSGLLESAGMGRVRILFFAGEVFPTPQLRRLRRALPRTRLYNLFGPTETNVCTYYEVPPDLPDGDDAPIPIGRACEHMETFVLDDDGREAAEGIEGTLWAKGPNLMQGYWADEARTASTLRPDPRGHGGAAYCTGDRVRLRPDGHYEFRGRRDHMIKVRGYRVELGEIETALASHPDVLEAVAIPIPDPVAGNRIVAIIRPRAQHAVHPAGLRAHCHRLLPLYMIPEAFESHEDLPRTSTGKVDRAALPALVRDRKEP